MRNGRHQPLVNVPNSQQPALHQKAGFLEMLGGVATLSLHLLSVLAHYLVSCSKALARFLLVLFPNMSVFLFMEGSL